MLTHGISAAELKGLRTRMSRHGIVRIAGDTYAVVVLTSIELEKLISAVEDASRLEDQVSELTKALLASAREIARFTGYKK